MSDEALFKRAAEVVLVRIVRAEMIPREGGGIPRFRAQYELIESFKGDAETIGQVLYEYEPHSILLTPGLTYLFFLNEDRGVGLCNGARRVIPEQETELLAHLRELKQDDV